MANENITWGEERIANELLLKLGIALSPRTVRKYMPKRSNHQGPRGDQGWSAFLKNHASAIVTCDFCVVVTANFRVLYAFVMIEHGSRRLIHTNVTANPTADWACNSENAVIVSHELFLQFHVVHTESEADGSSSSQSVRHELAPTIDITQSVLTSPGLIFAFRFRGEVIAQFRFDIFIRRRKFVSFAMWASVLAEYLPVIQSSRNRTFQVWHPGVDIVGEQVVTDALVRNIAGVVEST